jgi:hypothetical protein
MAWQSSLQPDILSKQKYPHSGLLESLEKQWHLNVRGCHESIRTAGSLNHYKNDGIRISETGHKDMRNHQDHQGHA